MPATLDELITRQAPSKTAGASLDELIGRQTPSKQGGASLDELIQKRSQSQTASTGLKEAAAFADKWLEEGAPQAPRPYPYVAAGMGGFSPDIRGPTRRPVMQPPERPEGYTGISAAPEPTFGEKVKRFFVGEPKYPSWTKPQQLNYLQRALDLPMNVITKFASGRTFGADELLWRLINIKRPDLADKSLEETMAELSPYERSGFNELAGDTAKFIGEIQSGKALLGKLGYTGPAGKQFVQRVARNAPAWMTSGAITELVKGVVTHKDAPQIAKDVATEVVVRGGESIAWTGVEWAGGKLFEVAMRKFPRFAEGWNQWVKAKKPEAIRTARAEVDVALKNYRETGDRTAWDAVRIKYAGIRPEGVEAIRGREPQIVQDFGQYPLGRPIQTPPTMPQKPPGVPQVARTPAKPTVTTPQGESPIGAREIAGMTVEQVDVIRTAKHNELGRLIRQVAEDEEYFGKDSIEAETSRKLEKDWTDQNAIWATISPAEIILKGAIEQTNRIAPQGEIAAENLIRNAFSDYTVTSANLRYTDGKISTGFVVFLPNGKQIAIDPTRNKIVFDLEKSAEAHEVKPERIIAAVGKYRSGLIELIKDFDSGTLSHEKFHALMDLLYSEQEKQTILKRYGTEEKAANAYRRLEGTTYGLFDRIRQFGESLRNTISGTVFPAPQGEIVPTKATRRLNPDEMTREQLYTAQEKQTDFERQTEEQILGDKWKPWNIAQRQQGSRNKQTAERASARIDEIESQLSKEDRDALYGIGETGLQAEDLHDKLRVRDSVLDAFDKGDFETARKILEEHNTEFWAAQTLREMGARTLTHQYVARTQLTAPQGEITAGQALDDTMVEAIALSSPSGKMSKRARDAANERLRVALFGEKGLQGPQVKQPTEIESLQRRSAMLRDLAKRGMSAKKFTKEADSIDAKIADLTKQAPAPQGEITPEDALFRVGQAQIEVEKAIKKHGFGGITEAEQHPNVVATERVVKAAFNDFYNSLNPKYKIGESFEWKGHNWTITQATFDITKSVDTQIKTGFPSTFDFRGIDATREDGKESRLFTGGKFYGPEVAWLREIDTSQVLKNVIAQATPKPAPAGISPKPIKTLLAPQGEIAAEQAPAKAETGKPVAQRPYASDPIMRNANAYALGDRSLAETLEKAKLTNPGEMAKYAKAAGEWHKTDEGWEPEMAAKYDTLARNIEKKLLGKQAPAPETSEVLWHASRGKLDVGKKFDITDYPDGLDLMDYMGIHLGTKKAAKQRTKSDLFEGEKAVISPFAAQIKKPFGNKVWQEDDLREVIRKYGQRQGITSDKNTARRAKEEMQKEGYDGILYYNIEEDPGSISKIVFSKEQLQQAPAKAEIVKQKAKVEKNRFADNTTTEKESYLGLLYNNQADWIRDPEKQTVYQEFKDSLTAKEKEDFKPVLGVLDKQITYQQAKQAPAPERKGIGKPGFALVPESIQNAPALVKELILPAEAKIGQLGLAGKKMVVRAIKADEVSHIKAARATEITKRSKSRMTKPERKAFGFAVNYVSWERDPRPTAQKKRGYKLRTPPTSINQRRGAEIFLRLTDAARLEYEGMGGVAKMGGIPFPQRMTKEGLKLYAEAMGAIDKRGKSNFKLLRDNGLIQAMIDDELAGDVGEAYAKLKRMRDHIRRPIYAYMERSKEPLPAKYLEQDIDKIVTHDFWKEMYNHVELARQFGVEHFRAMNYIKEIRDNFGENVEKEVQEWWDRVVGKTPTPTPLQVFSRKLAHAVGQYQVLKLSPLTSLQNFFQRWLSAMEFGPVTTIQGALRAWTPKGRAYARKTGAIPFDPQDAGLIADLKTVDSRAFARAWIEIIGMGTTERGNRGAAANIAAIGLWKDFQQLQNRPGPVGQFVRSLLTLGGESQGATERRLRAHGINWKQALKRGHLTLDELRLGSLREAKSKHFPVDLYTTPTWWQKSPWARQWAKYRIPFAYNMMTKIWKLSATEAAHGNFRPLAAFLLVSTLTGEIYHLWRKGLLGEDRSEMSIVRRLWENIVDGGAVGLFGGMMFGKDIVEKIINFGLGVHGATGKQVLETFGRKIPEAPEHTWDHILELVKREIPTVKYIDQAIHKNEHIREGNRWKIRDAEEAILKKEGDLGYYYEDVYNAAIANDPDSMLKAARKAIEHGATPESILSSMNAKAPSRTPYKERPKLGAELNVVEKDILRGLEREHDVAVARVRVLVGKSHAEYVVGLIETAQNKKSSPGEAGRAQTRLNNLGVSRSQYNYYERQARKQK